MNATSETLHDPVMVGEVQGILLETRPLRIVDGTVGAGGHARALLEGACAAALLGMDRDGEVLAHARAALAALGDRVTLVQGSYADFGEALAARGWDAADAVLLDVGVCSYHLDCAGAGFGLKQDAALDMRFCRTEGETAAQFIARVSEGELADVVYRFGEERRARRIARELKQALPRTTGALAAAVCRATRASGTDRRTHPAVKTFQALRIAVNRELDHLARFLRRFHRFLAPSGRTAVIAYHSLEDRMVKNAFARLAADGLGTVLTRRPLAPCKEEVARNPRSRSARLRAFERHAV